MTRSASSAPTSHVVVGAAPFRHEVRCARPPSSAPAVIAAVSARSTWSPSRTPWQAAAPLLGRPPALGPDEHGRMVERRRRRRRRSASGGAGQRRHRRRTSRPAPTSGSQRAAALHRRLAGDRRRRRRAWRAGLGLVPAHDAALGHERHDAVDAELGQLLDGQLGPLALDQGERHGERRARAGVGARRRRRPPARAPAPSRAGRHRPAPSPTVTASPGRQPQHPRQVVVVAADRRGRSRSSTKTWARAVERASPPGGDGAHDRLLERRADLRHQPARRAATRPRPAARPAGGRRSSSSSERSVGHVDHDLDQQVAPAAAARGGARPGPGAGTPCPTAVPRGISRSSAPSSVSKSSVAPSAACVNGTCSVVHEVGAVALEALVGRDPQVDVEVAGGAAPRADRARGPTAAGSSRCRRRRGCRRCRCAPRPRGPRPGTRRTGWR